METIEIEIVSVAFKTGQKERITVPNQGKAV
jgi:hypothetical protein